MDVEELFSCCRSGDIDKVRFLVEQRDVDVNVRDKWDSTPLYYACLCGHHTVVEYLIGVGGRCEANTFDGERCLYGALTDEIRRTLTQHSLITAHTIRRDAFNEFLRRVYRSGEESDVIISILGKEFKLHKCVLSARSPYFCHMFSSRWRHRKRININKDLIHPSAFEAVMEYVYTSRLECPFDLVDQCEMIAVNCKLPFFHEHIGEALKRAHYLQLEKQGRVKITTVVIEAEDCGSEAVESDLRELAQTTLPPELRVWPTEMPFCHAGFPSLADISFVVEGLSFMCHKMFFSPRSEYFGALFQDHFSETVWGGDPESPVPTISLHHVSAHVFSVVVMYLYCNQICVTEDNATDVLVAADMYLLPGLKRQCGVFLGRILTLENVLPLHQLSRVFELPRLEDHCVAFMARHFHQLTQSPHLRELIRRDANEVKGRQETDTVTIVDELRFHLTSHLQDVSDIEDTNAKLSILEDILEDLGIEA